MMSAKSNGNLIPTIIWKWQRIHRDVLKKVEVGYCGVFTKAG